MTVRLRRRQPDRRRHNLRRDLGMSFKDKLQDINNPHFGPKPEILHVDQGHRQALFSVIPPPGNPTGRGL